MRGRAMCWLLAAGLAACGGDSRDEPQPDAGPAGDASPDASDAGAPIAFGLALFTPPPTADELADVRATWDARDTSARDVTVEATGSVTLGEVAMTYRVLAHAVGGVRHVGAVLVPDGLSRPASAPVLVYAHGGYTGEGGLPPFRVEDLPFRIPGQPLRSQIIYVIPAYRGERIEVGGAEFAAEGAASVGDLDVDDAMALLSAAFEQVPQADVARVAVLGESRGGLVALEMGARDPRVDLVLDAFGTTDFRIGLETAGVDHELLVASVRQALIDPDAPANLLLRSIVPLDQVSEGPDDGLLISAAGHRLLRENLARTAPVAYVDWLPVTEVHHGTADQTASVTYSRALRDAMEAAGRPSPGPDFTYFEYEGGEHDLPGLPGAVGRIGDAIDRVLMPPASSPSR